LNTIEVVAQKAGRLSATRNLLGKAEGAQNLDGTRLKGSLLRPRHAKLVRLNPPSKGLPTADALERRNSSDYGIAIPRIDDPDKRIYVYEDDEDALASRYERFVQAARAIEARGFGMVPITRIADRLANRGGVVEPWYRSLDRANEAEEKEIANAIAEWGRWGYHSRAHFLSNRLPLHW
jgi:hypothetical protein